MYFADLMGSEALATDYAQLEETAQVNNVSRTPQWAEWPHHSGLSGLSGLIR